MSAKFFLLVRISFELLALVTAKQACKSEVEDKSGGKNLQSRRFNVIQNASIMELTKLQEVNVNFEVREHKRNL